MTRLSFICIFICFYVFFFFFFLLFSPLLYIQFTNIQATSHNKLNNEVHISQTAENVLFAGIRVKNKITLLCAAHLILNNHDFFFFQTNDNSIVIEILNRIVNNHFKQTCLLFVWNLDIIGILLVEGLSKNAIRFKILVSDSKVFLIEINYCGVKIELHCALKMLPHIPTDDFKIEVDSDTFESNSEFTQTSLANNYINNARQILNDLSQTRFYVGNENTLLYRKSLSLAGFAYSLFFNNYNNYAIDVKLSDEQNCYTRNAFFGGRCEVFGNLRENEYIKYFDFHGMYANCMKEEFHIGKGRFSTPSKIETPGFYHITYCSKDSFIPILPSYKNRTLFFSNGTKSGIFWYEEIQLFLKFGGKVLKIHEALLFNNVAKIFLNYVEKFSELRKNYGIVNRLGKFMINSLYGSLALQNKNEFCYVTYSEPEFRNIYANTNVRKFFKINDCFVLTIINDFKSKFFFSKNFLSTKENRNVSYAAAISAKARIRLYLLMNETIQDKGRLLYCDTDSIFAAYPKSDLRLSAHTFQWQETYDDGIFISNKFYVLKKQNSEIIKCPNNEKIDIPFDILKQKFLTSRIENLNKKNLNNPLLLNNYNKRKFLQNKTTTEPLDDSHPYIDVPL